MSVKDANGQVTRYTYDVSGNRITQSDARVGDQVPATTSSIACGQGISGRSQGFTGVRRGGPGCQAHCGQRRSYHVRIRHPRPRGEAHVPDLRP
ncbi:MAG: RHS repeat protein [Fibrobacteres bacterium]|nr:RHS repeat protein [Fibrobacterota bacterium]